jgi:hypothetical protein
MTRKQAIHRRRRIHVSVRTEQHDLVKLSETGGLRLEDRTQDIRGLDIYDRGGDQIGTVEDLNFDKVEQKCAS